MVFLISNYLAFKNTGNLHWLLWNVSPHWPVINKAPFFWNDLKCGAFSQWLFFSFLGSENIILASCGHPVIHQWMLLTQHLHWGGWVGTWIGEVRVWPFLHRFTRQSFLSFPQVCASTIGGHLWRSLGSSNALESMSKSQRRCIASCC